MKLAHTATPYTVTLDQFKQDVAFRRVAQPLDPKNFPTIRDAQLYIRNDGLILNADGWYHPDDVVIGTIMYAPDKQGSKMIFGHPYQRLTQYPGSDIPIPFPDRATVYAQYDKRFAKPVIDQPFAVYKQVIPRDELVAYISSEYAYEVSIPLISKTNPEVLEDIADIDKTLGLDLSVVQKGFTGSPARGDYNDLHDLDIVFSGSLEENIAIARAIRQLVRKNPTYRLFENGKGWNIRFLNDRKTLICCFFTYKNSRDAALSNFSMGVVAPRLELDAVVTEDLHTMYVPSVVTVRPSAQSRAKHRNLPASLPIITYHAGFRGDCFAGDTVRATGSLVEVATPTDSFLGLCVVERDGLVNLTPTWDAYYG